MDILKEGISVNIYIDAKWKGHKQFEGIKAMLLLHFYTYALPRYDNLT